MAGELLRRRWRSAATATSSSPYLPRRRRRHRATATFTAALVTTAAAALEAAAIAAIAIATAAIAAAATSVAAAFTAASLAAVCCWRERRQRAAAASRRARFFVPSAGPWPLLVTQCHAEDRILGAEDLLDRLGRLFQYFDRGERLPSALQPALSLQPFHRSRVPCLTVLRLWQWCPLLSASQICGMSRRRLADASVLRIRLRSDLGLSSAEVTTPKPVSKKLFE